MQIRDRTLPVASSTLSTLITELGSECQIYDDSATINAQIP